MDELLISNRPLLYLRGFERTKRLVLGLSEHFRDTYYCRSPHSSLRGNTLSRLSTVKMMRFIVFYSLGQDRGTASKAAGRKP